jgi:cyclopropane-fatty-acyl-phospholipid synthase
VRQFTFEHSRAAYRADFAICAVCIVALAAFLVLRAPPAQWLELTALAVSGLAAWPAVEYALHRFVLHGLPPFRSWHVQHHRRPWALICAPTIVSAMLIGTLLFLPALLVGGLWRAGALTFGVLSGFLAYAVVHHAIHHWRAEGAWLKECKRRHFHHHREFGQAACYGVTTRLWDDLFGTAGRLPPDSATARRAAGG